MFVDDFEEKLTRSQTGGIRGLTVGFAFRVVACITKKQRKERMRNRTERSIKSIKSF